MKKGLVIFFIISINCPFFAQHIVEKSIETKGEDIEIYLNKIDNLVLKSSSTLNVDVKLSDVQETFSNIKLVKEKGHVIIRSNKPLPSQNIINKFCVEQVNFASYVITVPTKSNVYINIGSGNLFAKNFEGNINAEIGTGEVVFERIKGNVKLSILDGSVKVKLRAASLNLKTNLGKIVTDIKIKSLKIESNKIEGVYKDNKQSLIIKAIKANIYLDAVKD
jgi:hypothetical protein